VFIVNIIFMLGRMCIGRMSGSEYVIRNYLIEAKKKESRMVKGIKKKQTNKNG
jgi:hypothetical protein